MLITITPDGESFTLYFNEAIITLSKEDLRALHEEIEGVLVIHDSQYSIVDDDN